MLEAILFLKVVAVNWENNFNFLSNIYDGETTRILNKIYKYKHEMIYSKVMKQYKNYRLNTVFNL